MRVATANIQNLPDMARPKVVADARQAGLVADVVGFQEIGEAEDHVDVVAGLGEGWELALGGLSASGCDNPIGYDTTEWGLENTGNVLLHHGAAKISMPRWLVWADLRRLERDIVIRFVNVHFTAGVWGPHDNRRDDAATRRSMWETDYGVAQDFISESLAQDIPVVMTGDTNNRNCRAPNGGKLAYGPSIDKIFVFPAGDVTFDVKEGETLPLNSDHSLRVVRVGIRAPKPEPVPHACDVCGFLHLPPA